MKKLILLLLFLLIPSICFSGSAQNNLLNILKSRSAVAAPSCTTADDVKVWGPVGVAPDVSASEPWMGQRIILTAQTLVTMYRITGCEDAHTGTLDVMVMNNGANEPNEGSIVANSTKSLGHASMADCYPITPTLDFEVASPFLLDAGTYWVVTKEISSYSLLASHDTTSTGDRYCYSINSGANWTCADNSAINYAVWGCE